MFTDMVGYSKRVHEDEETALRLLAEHNRVLQAQIEAHSGNTIKTIGDAFMADFGSAFSAVNCAVELYPDDRAGYYYYGLYFQYLANDNAKEIEQYDRAIAEIGGV